MSDPHRPEGSDSTRQGAESTAQAPYPPYVDPAYAGQLPMYPNPTAQWAQRPWPAGQPPPGRPPSGSPVDGGESGPPEPPRSPRWLWLVAGAAALLVVGLVIALMIVNGSAKKSTTVSPLPTMPGATAPTRIPTPTRLPPGPSTGTAPPSAGTPQTVVYSVTGQGRAISIAYIDTGGVLQTEFNVTLPWSKQISLTPPASTAASVTVVNIGEQITCSVTVDGTQVRQRTGTILTICAAAG
jgi:hypothetical protein